MTERAQLPDPTFRERARRHAAAIPAIVAFAVAGGTIVWALSPAGGSDSTAPPSSSTTSIVDPDADGMPTTDNRSSSIADEEHQAGDGDVHGDAALDGGSEAAECELPVASHAGTSDHGHTLHDSTGGRAVTDADCVAAEAWYEEVSTAALARFSDVEVAIAAGYRISKQSSDSPNPLDHYLLHGGNESVLDADLPEGLVYWTDPSTGTALLYGVVFIERGDELQQPGGPLTVWHDHHDPASCVELNDDCDLETGAANAPRMLHVWFFDGVVDVFAHDYPGAVGSEGRRRLS
jgi:hypothetical protein